MIHIAVDLMGGDTQPQERLRAVVRFANAHSDCKQYLFVTSEVKDRLQAELKRPYDGLEFIVCDQDISMGESPLKALRKKRDSSLSKAIQHVAEQQADVVVTAGNTGAMVVLARHWLSHMADIERPALATLLPGNGKRTLLLDVGATVDYRAVDLVNLAYMGTAAASALNKELKTPEVALLNIGTEAIKGNDAVQQADRLISDSELNYIGYCEGKHLFTGYADVVCCDGFVGNVVLKACEGMADLALQKKRFSWLQNWFRNSARINPSQYNGAMLLGLNGLIIKSHGDSDSTGFYYALEQARINVQNELIKKMQAIFI